MSPIAILGAGSWGTALACLIARNGHPVHLWGRNDYIQDLIATGYNDRYLPGIPLPESIKIFSDLSEAITGIQDILVVVPSHAFRTTIGCLYELKPHDVRIAWATKGLSGKGNHLLNEVVLDIYQKQIPMGVIAGPSFAKEVAASMPTAVTLTSNDSSFSQDLAARLHGRHFRVYTQTDFVGVQVCGAVKNGLAIATGISDGLGYGANSRSALITRGLTEMTRLGLAMGGNQETFMGLAGLGDLVLTCTDDQSRNRRFGYAIGKGLSNDEAEQSIGQVVEGRTNVFKVHALAKKYQVYMPITELVCQVLEGNISPFECVETLFAREPKPEKI